MAHETYTSSCHQSFFLFAAALYARTLWETITLSQDSHIPEYLQQPFIARGAMELARSLWQSAENGGIPPEEQRETGVEAIMLARRALEIYTEVYGAESEQVANSIGILADVLDYFNDVDDDEVLRLFEQSKAICVRMEGSLSPNVAANEKNLGIAYERRERRALAAHDLDRYVANLELTLSRFRESARVFRASNRMDDADRAAQDAFKIEECLRDFTANKAAATIR